MLICVEQQEGLLSRLKVGSRVGLQESQALRQALLATLVVAMFGTSLDAMANLNQFEANT